MSANFDPFGEMFGAAQTEYYVEPPAGVPGQQTFIADQPVSIISYPIQGDYVVAGRAVAKGTDITAAVDKPWNLNSPYGIVPLASGATAADVLGVAVWDAGTRRNYTTGLPGKYPNTMQGVMKKGYMFVSLYQDTVADAGVYVVVNGTNALTAEIGEFAADDLGGAAVLVPGITWWASYTTATTPVGVIKIDL